MENVDAARERRAKECNKNYRVVVVTISGGNSRSNKGMFFHVVTIFTAATATPLSLFLLTLISLQSHQSNNDPWNGASAQTLLPQRKFLTTQPRLASPLGLAKVNCLDNASVINLATDKRKWKTPECGDKKDNNDNDNDNDNDDNNDSDNGNDNNSDNDSDNDNDNNDNHNDNNNGNNNDETSTNAIASDNGRDYPSDLPRHPWKPAPAKRSGRPQLWPDPLRALGRRHVVPEKLQYTPEITIKQGRLVGITRHMQPHTGLQDVDLYLGLPYAEAPVGNRRFMPPGAPLPWQGLKMAHHLPPVCPQRLPDLNAQINAKSSRGRYKQLLRLLPYLKTESEDCLYLNIYVPRANGDRKHESLYPVIVYVHGESFEWNSGNPYDGAVLASYGHVIVITLNYRLGVLGFLKPSINDNAVANFGLLDQIAALHWIKENAASFGGDRDSVTLMGHGNGAACINYLMVSPVAAGLFHRAILMSGSAMADWAAANHSLRLTMQIAHSLDCPLNDDQDQMLDCLRGKRYQDIIKASAAYQQQSQSLAPIVDGHVIPNEPFKAMSQYTDLFSRYDLLFGVTESEAYHTMDATSLEEGLSESDRDNMLYLYMRSRFNIRPDLAVAATLKKYNDLYNNPIKATDMEHRDIVLDILSDGRTVGPLLQTGLFHADVNPRTFMYVFGHNSAAGPHASLPHSIAGEELAFVFGAPLAPAGPFPSSYSGHEKLLSEAVMAYWTNFAKTGNPKSPWSGIFKNLNAIDWDRYDLDWPAFNKRTQTYVNIGIPPSIGYKYRQIYMSFWNRELPDELSQIASIQQQPLLHALAGGQQLRAGPPTEPLRGHDGGAEGGGGGRDDVVMGHMSRFGDRGNYGDDPVRTLKLLLQEPYGKAVRAETAENMYNAPPTFGVVKKLADEGPPLATAPPASPPLHVPVLAKEKEVARSEATIHLLIGLIAIFIVLNVAIYFAFLVQKKKKSTSTILRKLGAGGGGGGGGSGGFLSYDGNTEDELKRSKHTTNDGDDSYVLDIVRKPDAYYTVKMDGSPPTNGFRISHQLSSSTMDTHTKVCEWMLGAGTNAAAVTGAGDGGAGGICGGGGGGSGGHVVTLRKDGSMSKGSKKSSSPTFSSLRGSSSGGHASSFAKPPQKVSVAIDATPHTRSQSVLLQEPIEMTKLKADGRNIIICQEVEVDQELLTPQDTLDAAPCCLLARQHSAPMEPRPTDPPADYLPIVHKHSRSDPVEMMYQHTHTHSNTQKGDDEQVTSFINATLHGADINVTSRDENDPRLASTAVHEGVEQVALLKRRNYPKVLPTATTRLTDSPPMTSDLAALTRKRNSMPPNGYLWHQIAGCAAMGRQPPLPPPRTISTLGRRPVGAARRISGYITTSPVALAQDFAVEEEPPTISENTLIVGPIVPKCEYATMRRPKRDPHHGQGLKESRIAAEQQPEATPLLGHVVEAGATASADEGGADKCRRLHHGVATSASFAVSMNGGVATLTGDSNLPMTTKWGPVESRNNFPDRSDRRRPSNDAAASDEREFINATGTRTTTTTTMTAATTATTSTASMVDAPQHHCVAPTGDIVSSPARPPSDNNSSRDSSASTDSSSSVATVRTELKQK